MLMEDMKQLVRDHYEAGVHRGDMQAVERQLNPDFVDHDVLPGTPPGLESTKEYLISLRRAFPDMRVTIEDMIAEGDRVAVRAIWRGTHVGEFMGMAPTNRHFTMSGMVFWRVHNGKLAERWANLDRLSLLRQLGALPPH